MDSLLFDEYKVLKESGQKAAAAEKLRAFIKSFIGIDEMKTWAQWYLETQWTGHKVRHELYAEVIFPVLANGYRDRDPWAIRWLARTAQNLYQNRALWAEIDCKTDHALLKDLLALCPDDNDARQDLLTQQVAWFRFCVHEWPAGILYGMDGATAAQCDEILSEIALTRKLDLAQQYAAFLADFEQKVVQYQTRPA